MLAKKTIKHHHAKGDVHELTFSCFHHMPLLTNDLWREMFCHAIDWSCERHKVKLAALVLMPEHVHMLVFSYSTELSVDSFLYAMKRPFSYRIKQLLLESRSPLLKKLTIQERPGKTTFRFWQEGPGYDRNFFSHKSVLAAVDYIHDNPTRRGLCRRAIDWRWSSAHWYASNCQQCDSNLPAFSRLPTEFWN